jgi:hypothetical protein
MEIKKDERETEANPNTYIHAQNKINHKGK